MTFWRSWMTDLTGRGPIGLKTGKPAKRPRKPIPRMSAKKRAHKAAERALGASEHMAWVKSLPCLVCGCYGVDVHHEGKPRSDFNVLPLCPPHHRRKYGPGAFHYRHQAFCALHGSSADLPARVAKMVVTRGGR